MAQEKSVRDESVAKLKEEFRYGSSPLLEKPKETNDGIVSMPAFTVTESIGSRRISQTIQDYAVRLNAKNFTVTKGGAIATKNFGKVQGQFGVWGEDGGFQILRFGW